jgi:hypothetical protein
VARTTDILVGGIIEVDATIPLEPFITAANQLVTELLTSKGHSADRLEMIERYLSAHFYTLRDPRPVVETAGPVSQTNQSKVDLYLCTSHYGQTAILLDTSGTLAAVNDEAKGGGKKTATVYWVGYHRHSDLTHDTN